MVEHFRRIDPVPARVLNQILVEHLAIPVNN
jgi:hypothetical protein